MDDYNKKYDKKRKEDHIRKNNIFKYAVIFRQCLFTKFLIK